MVIVYNDYYLSSIDSKLSNTNNMLDEVIDNQSTLISGDSLIYNEIHTTNILLHFYGIWVIILLFAVIFYHFYVSCFKGR